jgi:lysophospholipase L1-like esterase
MRARVLVLVALVAVAATVAFAGLGDHDGQKVLVVGDSITEQSEDELTFSLRSAGWEPTVEGHSGSAIFGARWGVDWKARLGELVPTVDPDVAVVELGTNDKDIGASDIAHGIDAAMEPLRHVPRVIWANVKTGFLTAPVAEVVNEELRKATVRWPNLEVLDMGAHFAPHPEWLSDGIHLNDAGKVEFGRLVIRALAAPPSRVGALSPVL